MTTHQIDYYKTLGVSEDANADEIKKAYRNLAKKYHPDRTGGDKAKEARFKEIGQAYDVLGDAAKRRQYDAVRSGAQFQGFPGVTSDANAGFSTDGFGGLGDIFAQMFTGGGARAAQSGPGGVHFRFTRGDGDPVGAGTPFQSGRPTRPTGQPRRERKIQLSDGTSAQQRGNDIHSDVRLSLDQAILGCVVEVATLAGSSKVKIPPGTGSGVKLRLKDKGARGSAGQGPGNHYVTVHIDVPKQLDDKAKKLLIQFMQRVKKT